jgi:hypothetical protein
VLPYLSLVDAFPASAAGLSAFIEDVGVRAQEARHKHGRIPVLLVDGLERLVHPTRDRRLLHTLSRLDHALTAESIPGLLATTATDLSAHDSDRFPVQTLLSLAPVSASGRETLKRVDLELRTRAHTSRTETLPLLLDCRSGLYAHAAAGEE